MKKFLTFVFVLLGISLNVYSKEENIAHKSIFGFIIDLPKTYIAVNKNNFDKVFHVDELKKLKNIDPDLLIRFKIGTEVKKQEIYLDKNNLSKNGFIDHILLGYENYNYEDEFYSLYNNELEKVCADFTDVYKKSFRTIEKCYFIKYNNKKAFNLMGQSSKNVFYYQVFYLFRNRTMIFTMSCQDNCEKIATDLNDIIYSLEKNNLIKSSL